MCNEQNYYEHKATPLHNYLPYLCAAFEAKATATYRLRNRTMATIGAVAAATTTKLNPDDHDRHTSDTIKQTILEEINRLGNESTYLWYAFQ